MKIIFVRHGHPNYKEDCLTELGVSQANAAAERLKGLQIDRFFSSTNGRARETAEHINKYHGKEITGLPFMRELGFMTVTPGFEDKYPQIPTETSADPWKAVKITVADNATLHDNNWFDAPLYAKFQYTKKALWVGEQFDLFLEGFGIKRCGEYYVKSEDSSDETILIASHAGSSSAVLAHLFNLPLPFVIHTLSPNFTSVTVVEISGAAGAVIAPKLALFNDARHIESNPGQNKYH
jgi:probable phosphoglycerate mutase